MSRSRISKTRLATSDAIPPHHLDPIKKNPAPPGHPAHEVWETATRLAELELFNYQAQMLQIQARTGREFGEWYIKLAFQTLQIWAKRGVSIVATWADVRAYEKWLVSYRKHYLRDAERYLARNIVEGPHLVETLMVELSVQLVRAERHWTATAIAKVSAAVPPQVPAEAAGTVPAQGVGAEPPAESPAATAETDFGINIDPLSAEKAARRRLLNEYKAECKWLDIRMTYESITRAVNPRWKSRSQIDKWLAYTYVGEYDREVDRRIRKYLTSEIERIKKLRLAGPRD
jgi:hypothetical protein